MPGPILMRRSIALLANAARPLTAPSGIACLTERAPPGTAGREIVRALFVPRIASGAPRVVGVHVVMQADVI